MDAMSYGRVDEAVLLVKAGAKLRVPRPHGEYPMLVAALSGARTWPGLWEVAGAIVAAGENVTDVMGSRDPHPLRNSSKEYQLKWTNFYLDHGGNPCAKWFGQLLSHIPCEECVDIVSKARQHCTN